MVVLSIILTLIGVFSIILKGESISRRQQTSIVQYLLEHYEDVEKIEIKERTENTSTKSDRIVAIVNDSIWLSFQVNHKTNDISMSHLASRNNGKFLKESSNHSTQKATQSVLIKYLEE